MNSDIVKLDALCQWLEKKKIHVPCATCFNCSAYNNKLSVYSAECWKHIIKKEVIKNEMAD